MPELSNPRHEAFAQAYVRTRHGPRAMREAGFEVQSGASQSHWYLTRPHIAARIRELTEGALLSVNITAERVMAELGRVAFQDVRDIFDDDGNLIPPHLLTDDAASTIASIDVEVRWEGKGDEAVPVTTKKIRRTDKMAALSLLAKHFKIVGDEGDGVNALASALADRLNTAKKRLDPGQDVEDARIIEPRALDHQPAAEPFDFQRAAPAHQQPVAARPHKETDDEDISR